MPHFDDFTPSQGPGPFYTMTLLYDNHEVGVDSDSPDAIRIKGTVYDGGGTPIRPPDALLEFLQGDAFARTITTPQGEYEVVMRKPGRIPLRDGRLQAPFIFARIFIFPLMESFETRVYFSDEEEANSEDPVLQLVSADERGTLIGKFADGVLHFDIHLSGENQTVYFAPEEGPSIGDAPETRVHSAIHSFAQ
jgi:protocatechuate 3,4-dioxygenase alpha subunit